MRLNFVLVVSSFASFASTALARSYNYARDPELGYYNDGIQERETYTSKVAQFIRSLDDEEIEVLLRRDWKGVAKKIKAVTKFKSAKAWDKVKQKVKKGGEGTTQGTTSVKHPTYDANGRQTNNGYTMGLH